jgi:hypothetical protein
MYAEDASKKSHGERTTSMNTDWHQQNRMPKTLEQRIDWHVEHERACGCRPMPDSVSSALAARSSSAARTPTRAEIENILREAYAKFNARDIEGVIALMRPDVEWPNAWEGGWLKGRAAVHDYWTRQWAAIDPHVEPVRFEEPAGAETVRVVVDQTVRDLQGNVIATNRVQHVYYLEGTLIQRMEVVGEK